MLPRPDTLSVEAAARAATGDKLNDLHVVQACIRGTSTFVTLFTTEHAPTPGRREKWMMGCERLQSTWAKRGGWKCDTPGIRRTIDTTISFLGTQRALSILSDTDASFEATEALARRALAALEREAPAPEHCEAGIPLRTPADNDFEWKQLRGQQLPGADASRIDVYLSAEEGALRIEPFGPFSSLALDYGPDAAADPEHAPICWARFLYID